MRPLGDTAVTRLLVQLGTPANVAERYDMGELIGRGGMGEVYQAHDRRLDRTVAVKILAAGSSTPGAAERLRREANLLAVLEHPGIVPVYDAGTLEDGRTFYVMRFVDGVRLDEFARTESSRGELIRTLLRIADTVAFAHQCGIIHRDLKPANIMIGPFGEVLVLDWGVAKIIQQVDPPPAPALHGSSPDSLREQRALTADGVAVGTPGYMSPEQSAGESRMDQRTDVFAFGVMLREVLEAGREPIPKPLNAIVLRATASDPEKRYAAFPALADDLRKWLDGASVAAYQESWLEKGERFVKRHQVAILLLMGYAIVRMAILIWRGV